MLDTVRRLLAVAMLGLAVIGFLPLLPLVFGYQSATISNDVFATWFPAATTGTSNRFIHCAQTNVATPSAWSLKQNTSHSGSRLFQCSNNWHTDVSITIGLGNGNGVITSITSGAATLVPAGQTRCVSVTSLLTADVTASTSPVVYQAQATATNLSATIDFTGSVATKKGNGNPVQCTGL